MPIQIEVKNRLLSLAPAAAFARLAPHLEKRAFQQGDVIHRANEAGEFIFFPETCLGSVIALSNGGHRVESGIFGHDGFSGVPAMLDAGSSPYELIFQVPGDAYRITPAALLAVVDESPELRRLLLRYAHVASIQSGFTALSNAVHGIDVRLARWLLMCRDRLADDTLNLTHEFLSIMLGVRRPGVTTALHVLEGHLLIRGERGRITIRDRAGLEAYASDAYGAPEAEYRRLIGPMN